MPEDRPIFVFGSNRQGRHGKGAAKYAKDHYGAVYGQAEGLQGHSYAIPTKMTPYLSLSLDQIKVHVDKFIEFATANPDKTFEVTRIGCGLAGYTDEDIAPMFRTAPANCNLPEGWWRFDTCKKCNELILDEMGHMCP